MSIPILDHIENAKILTESGLHGIRYLNGKLEVNDNGTWVVASEPIEYLSTLFATDWVGASAPYTQTIIVAGITDTTKGDVGLAMSATSSQIDSAGTAKITATSLGLDSVTFTAFGERPTLDLPIVIIKVGD